MAGWMIQSWRAEMCFFVDFDGVGWVGWGEGLVYLSLYEELHIKAEFYSVVHTSN